MNNTLILEKVNLAKKLLQEVIDMVDPVPSPIPAPVVPAGREMPPAYDKCRPMWEAAQRDGIFKVANFTGAGLQTGDTPGGYGKLSAEKQNALEQAIQTLGYSPWGKQWLSYDPNAAMIDRRYCFAFMGYWVTRKSNNPDDGFVKVVSNPGPIPV